MSEDAPVRVAKVLRVVKQGAAGARLEIDGELFEFATVDGFTVHPRRSEMPSVTLTIAAYRVELVDDVTLSGAPDFSAVQVTERGPLSVSPTLTGTGH